MGRTLPVPAPDYKGKLATISCGFTRMIERNVRTPNMPVPLGTSALDTPGKYWATDQSPGSITVNADVRSNTNWSTGSWPLVFPVHVIDKLLVLRFWRYVLAGTWHISKCILSPLWPPFGALYKYGLLRFVRPSPSCIPPCRVRTPSSTRPR